MSVCGVIPTCAGRQCMCGAHRPRRVHRSGHTAVRARPGIFFSTSSDDGFIAVAYIKSGGLNFVVGHQPTSEWCFSRPFFGGTTASIHNRGTPPVRLVDQEVDSVYLDVLRHRRHPSYTAQAFLPPPSSTAPTPVKEVSAPSHRIVSYLTFARVVAAIVSGRDCGHLAGSGGISAPRETKIRPFHGVLDVLIC